jgi:Mn2+/Fe2+ NRAMP family transporter
VAVFTDSEPPHIQNLRTQKRRSVSGSRSRLATLIGNLGPGLITGASDDDPSGISTYSMAGATFGYSFLRTALFSFPLMTAVQLTCARLGTVKGKGLAAIVREQYPNWVLWGTSGLLLSANLVNASADLAGMANATQLRGRKPPSGLRSTPEPSLHCFFGPRTASFRISSVGSR